MGTQGSLRKKREGTGRPLWWSRCGPIQLVRWTAEGGYPHNCTQDKGSGLRARQIRDVRIWRVGPGLFPVLRLNLCSCDVCSPFLMWVRLTRQFRGYPR